MKLKLLGNASEHINDVEVLKVNSRCHDKGRQGGGVCRGLRRKKRLERVISVSGRVNRTTKERSLHIKSVTRSLNEIRPPGVGEFFCNAQLQVQTTGLAVMED